MPSITIERDPPMIVFRPPILEAVAGGTMLFAGLYQAITSTVPAPIGDGLAFLLGAGGLGAVLSWGFKSWWTSNLKRMEDERAELKKQREEEREEDRREREHQREQNRQLQEQIKEMVKHHQEEAKFWRERYLAEHGE